MWGNRRKYKIRIMTIFLILLFVLLLITERRLDPIIDVLARQEAHAKVERVVQEAIRDQMAQENVRDLTILEKDDSGQITYLMTDTMKLNGLSARIVLAIENAMDSMEKETIHVPLGVISGSKLFAAYGPAIPIHIIPVGTVEGQVTNSFTEAGINQTKHSMGMEISVAFQVAVPLDRFEMKVALSVPISESIIVGPIPDTYMNIGGSSLLSSILNQKSSE